MKLRTIILLSFALFTCYVPAAHAAEAGSYTRQEDVIYGRKYGMALTMDVFRPKEHANGLSR